MRGGHDTVPTCSFRCVERRIDPVVKGIEVVVLLKLTYADTDGHLDFDTVRPYGHFGDCTAKPLCNLHRVGFVGPGKQRRKLLSTHTGEDVTGTKCFLAKGHYIAQGGITSWVTEVIVDAFEVVEID